jgi:hypothetical protein
MQAFSLPLSPCLPAKSEIFFEFQGHYANQVCLKLGIVSSDQNSMGGNKSEKVA